MSFHSQETSGSIHIIHNYEYADATERLAATGFVAADVGKVSKQDDDSSFWVLTDHSPITWNLLAPCGGSGDVIGPASATDGYAALFDGTTGKLLKDGSIPAPQLPAASESAQGAAEIATQAETDTGTDDTKIVTPLKLAGYVPTSGCGHLRGARLNWASESQVSVGTTGESSQVLDSTDVLVMTWTGVKTAAITSSGAGGLDTGSEASDTWYAVHIIGDTNGVNAPAAMLSLSATSPTMPSGYDVFRRVGWTYNQADSNFRALKQTGGSTDRWVDWDSGSNYVLSGGNATSFTDVSCAGWAPTTANMLNLLIYIDSGSSTYEEYLYIRPNGYTTFSNAYAPGGATNGDYMGIMSTVPCDSSQVIEYMVDDAGADIWLSVQGYMDEL